MISDDPNVEATPASGTLASGESVPVQVQVGSGFTGTGATIHILTTGGRADVRLEYGSTLSGRLQGTVDVELPFGIVNHEVIKVIPQGEGVRVSFG